jgi:hypothetical protein
MQPIYGDSHTFHSGKMSYMHADERGGAERKAESVLVKWEGYKKPTWEPLSNMPDF